MDKIEVNVCGFEELFDKKVKTVVPDYQRPYVWGRKKAEELLKDFEEFFIRTEDTGKYFLGSILLYKNPSDNVFEIIDGQQRLTTLLLLSQVINGNLPNHQNIVFNSHQSVFYIKEAHTFFEQKADLLKKLSEKSFLNRLDFTKITTYSEDDAFTFFDTQNNRGIKLSATDFLKAYHLRAIKSEQLQENSAVHWENIGNKNNHQFIDFLFEKILWRARSWRGQQTAFENQDLILNTFQKQTLKSENEGSYPLYPSPSNIGYQEIRRNISGEHQFVSINAFTNSPLSFPFSLRQPIHKGLNFFDYTLKYTKTYELLFEEEVNSDDPIGKMRCYYTAVYSEDMSAYLKQFMQLCLILFYDSFGKKDILEAINHFDYLLGSLRFQKQQIKKEAVTRYLRDENINLLDMIAHAYLPQEVFKIIRDQRNLSTYYSKDKLPQKDGVQKRYLERLQGYYKKVYTKTNVTERELWLDLR